MRKYGIQSLDKFKITIRLLHTLGLKSCEIIIIEGLM